jgi:hypothetical protein
MIGNNIGPEAASKLSEALIKNSTLHTLDLSRIINSFIVNTYLL